MFEDKVPRLLQAFEDSAVGISITDSSGRFLSANRTFCTITGYTEQELAARDEWSITHPDDIAESRRAFERLFTDGVRTVVHEKRYLRKSGETIWARGSISLVWNSDGRAIKTVALIEDITAKRDAEEAMDRVSSQLRRLSMKLLRSQEDERRRIARELHDGAAQLLAGLNINLNQLRQADLDERRKLDLLAEAIALAGECSREVRALSYELHPPKVNELGLGAALESFVEGFRRRTGLHVELKIAPGLGRLDGDIGTAIFRIVQEGLSNIRRHSGSQVASIELQRGPRVVRLELRDHGRGFPSRMGRNPNVAVHLGIGIRGMCERVELLGGRLDITSGEAGTCLRATLPLMGTNEEVANPCRG